ncbi:MAG TPA: DUF6457 domain-containing protein [Acidimicrobiales bacterium]
MPTGREWIATFAAELGVEPLDDATVDTLLDLAGVAAHASERFAAPLTCYLTARAGADPAAALALARRLAEAGDDSDDSDGSDGGDEGADGS